jgi:hypothetical protein
VIVDQYLRHELSSDHFVEQLGVLYSQPKNPIVKFMLPYISFPHKCMYDKSTLLSAVNQVGFSANLEDPFHSQISEIDIIEDSSRTFEAVIVEGIKL